MHVCWRAAGAALLGLALGWPTAADAQRGGRREGDDERQGTRGSISAGDLRLRLRAFAHDSMNGRATGTDGHERATRYIADELRRVGLKPAGDSGTYFQTVPMVRRHFGDDASVTAGGRRFSIGADFGVLVARGGTPRLATTATAIFGGELGDTARQISAAQAAGRVVVLRPGTRRPQPNPRALFVEMGSRFADAAAVVIPVWHEIPASFRVQLGQPVLQLRAERNVVSMTGERTLLPAPALPPTLLVTDAFVEALFGRGAAVLGATGESVGFDLQFSESPALARNVVAVLPGRDPALRGQYVAVLSHTDHEPARTRAVDHDSARTMAQLRRALAERMQGRDRRAATEFAELKVNVDSLRAIRPARPDSIMNGADDNGSGSMAALEIAEAFASDPERPRRSLLFVWHAAEELGLIGAGWFTEQPTVPRDSIVGAYNLDMVGRGHEGDIAGGGPEYLQVIGARRLSREFGAILDDVNGARRMPFTFDLSHDASGHPQAMWCRSDHAMYARYGIPVAFLTTGSHADYHQVTDEAQYIDYRKLSAVADLVRDAVRVLADRAERPRLDRSRPDPQERCRQ